MEKCCDSEAVDASAVCPIGTPYAPSWRPFRGWETVHVLIGSPLRGEVLRRHQESLRCLRVSAKRNSVANPRESALSVHFLSDFGQCTLRDQGRLEIIPD